MSYWTKKEYEQTREKINPVSAWWGKKPVENRSTILSYIDSKVLHTIHENDSVEINIDVSFIADL